MNCYFVGYTKFPYFVPIIQLIWAPQTVHVSDWPIKKVSSKTILPSKLKFGRKHLWIKFPQNKMTDPLVIL